MNRFITFALVFLLIFGFFFKLYELSYFAWSLPELIERVTKDVEENHWMDSEEQEIIELEAMDHKLIVRRQPESGMTTDAPLILQCSNGEEIHFWGYTIGEVFKFNCGK